MSSKLLLLAGVPQLDLTGLVGETVRLPCKVDTETCGDMHSIKWYRGSSRIYVFSEMSNIAHAEGDYTASFKIRCDRRHFANKRNRKFCLFVHAAKSNLKSNFRSVKLLEDSRKTFLKESGHRKQKRGALSS
ncbi:Uncharacterized protein GBIM_02887 [Gryllus bimaculatus]|nr:Uncharacterized protein GBIM_02887 [Gryllus bimaculatus]